MSLTRGVDAVASENTVVSDQPCLIETCQRKPNEKNCNGIKSNKRKRKNSLDSFSSHNVLHLLQTPLVQPKPGVAFPDIGFDVKRTGTEPSPSLICEG